MRRPIAALLVAAGLAACGSPDPSSRRHLGHHRDRAVLRGWLLNDKPCDQDDLAGHRAQLTADGRLHTMRTSLPFGQVSR